MILVAVRHLPAQHLPHIPKCYLACSGLILMVIVLLDRSTPHECQLMLHPGETKALSYERASACSLLVPGSAAFSLFAGSPVQQPHLCDICWMAAD